ncbi:hypothetical protein K4F52_005517 [Lecanicillium sp. MT-2017a]|nr:hypothetical protein K4F52_005517 [Lecanicillium sp. MT-2017a]
MEKLGFPGSVPVPPQLPPARQEDYPADLYNTYDSDHDLGITAYYIRMTLLLGSISPWLRDLRLAKYERPCSPDSTYAKLVARLYEYDSKLPSKHLLRNVAFSKRSPAEILEHRDYWTPWVLMEVECHACLSILNHPFIHLVASAKCSKSSQSGLFLQQTVDAALLNSGWFFRLLRSCEGHQLELWDPVLGHLVAAVATIPWMLQYVRDDSISQQAIKDLAWCKDAEVPQQRESALESDARYADSHHYTPQTPIDRIAGQQDSTEHGTTAARTVLFSPEGLDQMYIDDLFGHFGTRYP